MGVWWPVSPPIAAYPAATACAMSRVLGVLPYPPFPVTTSLRFQRSGIQTSKLMSDPGAADTLASTRQRADAGELRRPGLSGRASSTRSAARMVTELLFNVVNAARSHRSTAAGDWIAAQVKTNAIVQMRVMVSSRVL